MGGGGKNQEVEVPTYYMSEHHGICHWGEGITLVTVYAGDKLVMNTWNSDVTIHNLNRQNLFGGLKKEGGIKGKMTILPGKPDQVLPAHVAARYGGTPDSVPACRGIFSVFYSGYDDTVNVPNDPITGEPDYLNSTYVPGDVRGCLVAAVNPYIKNKRYRLRRPSRAPGLNPAYQYISLPNRSDGVGQVASNPAYVLYELKTNTVWGEGRSPSTIDIASFNAAAVTLYNENFGIGFKWMRQSTIETVTSEIIDHIQAALYDDPATGLLTLKLLRADYDVATLPTLTPSNCKLSHFKRKLWGEVTGEVTVTWTNPENEQEESVTVHDLSVIQAQGGSPVAAGRNFYMIRSAELAARVAERELVAMSHPLAACDATVHRPEVAYRPGDVVKITWPEHGLQNLPMRIMEVSPGSSMSGKMKLKLQEDIFALPPAQYIEPVQTLWDAQDGLPEDLVFNLATLPAYMTAKVLNKQTVGQLEYPSAAAGILVARPTTSYVSYDVYANVTNVIGGMLSGVVSTNAFPSSAQLAAPSGRASHSAIEIKNLSGPFPTEGDFVFLGGVNGEICVCTGFDPLTMQISLQRGCLDTVPSFYGTNTDVYIIKYSLNNVTDNVERSVGEEVDYRFLPATFRSILNLGDATQFSTTLTDRAYKPLRPANCKVNSDGFGPVTYSGTGDLFCSWSNRNRVTESQIVQSWNGANVNPEAGQTTNIRVYDNVTNALIIEYLQLPGTSHVIPIGDVAGSGDIRINFSSFIPAASNPLGADLESSRSFNIVVNGV